MYTDAFGLDALPDFYGSVYITAADSRHVAQDVTTHACTRTHTHMRVYVHTR